MKIATTKELADQYKEVVDAEQRAKTLREQYDSDIQKFAMEAIKLDKNKIYKFMHYATERVGRIIKVGLLQKSPVEIEICSVWMNRRAKDGSFTSKSARTELDKVLGEV